MGININKFNLQKMKFFALAFLAVVSAQEAEEGETAACTGAEGDCPPVDDAEQACATMTIGDFSVDQCVAKILCGETIEQDGQEMNFACIGAEAAKIAATAAAVLALASMQM